MPVSDLGELLHDTSPEFRQHAEKLYGLGKAIKDSPSEDQGNLVNILYELNSGTMARVFEMPYDWPLLVAATGRYPKFVGKAFFVLEEAWRYVKETISAPEELRYYFVDIVGAEALGRGVPLWELQGNIEAALRWAGEQVPAEQASSGVSY